MRFTADIQSPWHFYDLGPYDGGPVPVSFSLTPSSTVTPVGEMRALSEPVRVFDDIFGMEVGYFENQAIFSQLVELNGKGGVLAGTVEWVACNPETNECLPPTEYEFSVNIGYGAAEACEHRASERRTERNRFAVGVRHRSHTVGTCRAAHPVRIPDGANDRVVLP
ncbi:MAG: hypothetical protein L6V35_03015 [Alistipes putredinis]|nr:MAG: hypothetical protein L6V35_03015 [Alistipes putredinis]